MAKSQKKDNTIFRSTLTISQLAKSLGLSYSCVNNMIISGRLKAIAIPNEKRNSYVIPVKEAVKVGYDPNIELNIKLKEAYEQMRKDVVEDAIKQIKNSFGIVFNG